MVPKKIFFVKGVGVHKDKLASFEAALRDAGIETQNWYTFRAFFLPIARSLTKPKEFFC